VAGAKQDGHAMTTWLPGDPLRLGHRLLIDHAPGGWPWRPL
jgi:hypothetical protein